MSLARSPEPPIPISLKDALKTSSISGDLVQAKRILRRWRSEDPPFTPGDLTDSLNCAVSYRHPLLVQLLLEYGAVTSVTTASMAASNEPGSLPTFELLVQYGWRVDSIMDPVSKILTMNSVMLNDDGESLLRFFLSKGAPVDGLPADPGSPLRWAPSTSIAEILLENGATLKHTSSLHAAAAKHRQADSIALMNLYLDHGVDINELLFDGRPVTGRGNMDKDFGTALHIAAREGSKLAARAGSPEGGLERVKLLVERGADVKKLSKEGLTARDWAQLWERHKEKEYLEEIMTARGIPFADVVSEDDSPGEGEESYPDDRQLTLRICAQIL